MSSYFGQMVNPVQAPPAEFGSAEQVAGFLTSVVSQAFRVSALAGHQARKDPYGLSISGVGRCTKQAAYRLARVDPSDPALSWDIESLDNYRAARPDLPEDVRLSYNGRASRLGVWLHEGFLPVLADVLDVTTAEGPEGSCLVEQPVTLTVGPDDIDGTLDLWWPARGIVVDLKTLSEWMANKVRGSQSAFDDHRIQVGLYALAKHQAGQRPRWVAWVYLERDSGEPTLVVEEWTAQYLTDVSRAVANVQAWRENPDMIPPPKRGPGIAYECDSCPWLRRCWGESARPGRASVQSSLVQDKPQIAEVWQQYQEVNGQIKDLNDEKRFLRAVAEPHGPGIYGRTDVGYSKPAKNFDSKKALDRLAELSKLAGQAFDPEDFYTEGKGKLLVRAAREEQ